jgi:Zn finger protein HypA/HybF involved in hydrogenase expression
MEPGQNPATSGTKHEFPCNSCGAKLEFKPGADALQCPYCGAQQSIGPGAGGDSGQAAGGAPPPAAPPQEYSFEEALRNARTQPARSLAQNGQEVQCNGCGALSVVTGQASRCPFCDSPVVVHEADDQIIVPESVLPFKLDARAAKSIFKKWVSSRWFAPSDLASRATNQGMDGVYLPYWTYDSNTTTQYRGERGTYYYVTESYTDSQGKSATRQVRKTSWSPTWGTVNRFFDDVLVCASRSLPSKLVNDLEPWDLNALQPYDPAYLSGFLAERYGIDLQEGFGAAKHRMEPTIRNDIRADIGGDEQRITSMTTQHSNVMFKHFLLPLWISSFRYSEKLYRFVVNARTGEAAGERPYSWVKIAAAVVAGLALVGAIVWAINYFGDENPQPPPTDPTPVTTTVDPG